MSGVSRRALLLFAFGRSLTPKVIVQDMIIDVSIKLVSPELNILNNLRERIKHVKLQ